MDKHPAVSKPCKRLAATPDVARRYHGHQQMVLMDTRPTPLTNGSNSGRAVELDVDAAVDASLPRFRRPGLQPGKAPTSISAAWPEVLAGRAPSVPLR